MDELVYRYLQFKTRRSGKVVKAERVIKALLIPLRRVHELEAVAHVDSFGPVTLRTPQTLSQARRYARLNVFYASFRCTFKLHGRYCCIKDRLLRKGCNKPRSVSIHNKG